MPDVDPIERQIRQVRRRRNLRELQRGLYFLIAIAALSAAALVLLALTASPALFAVVTWSVGGAVTVTALLLVRELRRQWIAPERAAPWIDERTGLDGRLATLIAVRARPASGGGRSFLPLLLAENLERLARWRPERVVGRRVPRGALASAITATAALALALLLGPGLRPHVPEIVYSDEPVDASEATDDGGVPDRIVVAPARGRAEPRRRDGGTPVAGRDASGAPEDDSALARLSSDLQDRIRRELWGREWERTRDAMARAERERAAEEAAANGAGEAGDGLERSDGDEDSADEPWEPSGLASTRRGARRAAGRNRDTAGSRGESSAADDAARGFGDDTETSATGAGEGEAARGAGNGTDPNLFGAATEPGTEGGDTFELGIAAPVRARQAGPRRATGEPPPASADAHPETARATRAEQAIRKMPVPPAYEAIVREVFAHRGDPRP